MITPKPFYRGLPPDGTAGAGTGTTYVTAHDLGAQVPTYKKWRIEEIVVCNMTQVDGYYTVAVFPESVTNLTVQDDMAAMNTASPLPRSTSASIPGGTGFWLAYSQPIPAVTTFTMPIVAYALSGEKLWAGVYPGAISLVGFGGVSLTISGREYRD